MVPLQAMKVTFYNIGQGNATIITCPNQKTMLVDAGSSRAPDDDTKCEKALALMVKNITGNTPDKELLVVASHADKDHINKLTEISKKLLDKKFKLSFLLGGSKDNFEKTDVGKKLLTVINNNSKKCSLTFASDIKGTGAERSKEFKKIVPTYCTVLSALVDQKDVNDTSIVLRVADENVSAFLPGDATGQATDEIINDIWRKIKMKSEVFEISHHGAETHNCTSLPLLLVVNPKKIVISSGLMYGHPRFEVIKTIATYCIRKKRAATQPHMLTYQKPEGIPVYKGEKDETHLNVVAIGDDEFCTAQTTFPIYNTVDSGTIAYDQQNISVSNMRSTHTQRGIGALQGIQTPRFDGMRLLFFNNMEIESDQLKTYFPHLPKNLEYLDLRNNNIGHFGIKHLITLYKNHSKDLMIKLAENRLVDKKQLTTVCNNETIKEITSNNRMLITFSKKSLEKDTVDSLKFTRSHTNTPPKQTIQALSYTLDNTAQNTEAHANKNRAANEAISFDKQNLYIKPLKGKTKGYSYEWPGIIDVHAISDSIQNVAGVTTSQNSFLFDYKKNAYKALQGLFRYTNLTKPWKLVGKEFWSLDMPGISYFHERSPLSMNGKYVMTVSKKNKCINIYQTDALVFDPDQVKLYKSIKESEIQEEFKHSIADIKRVEFTDNDHSIKIHFLDKSVPVELRYILELEGLE